MNSMSQDVLTLDEVAQSPRLPRGEVDGRAIFLSQAGALSDDETLAELRDSIYAERGRPEVAVLT